MVLLMKKLQKLAAVLLAAALLAGCAAAGTSSAAPAPSPTPTATPTPTPTPTPAEPALNFNPLTGIADADYANCRPVAVTLRTIYGAQPQWGVASADVLMHHARHAGAVRQGR